MDAGKTIINNIITIKRNIGDIIRDRLYIKDFSNKIIELLYELDDYSHMIGVEIVQKTDLHKCLKPLLNYSEAYSDMKEACQTILETIMKNIRNELFFDNKDYLDDIQDEFDWDINDLCNELKLQINKNNDENYDENCIVRTDGKYLEAIKKIEMNMLLETKRRIRVRKGDIDNKVFKGEGNGYCPSYNENVNKNNSQKDIEKNDNMDRQIIEDYNNNNSNNNDKSGITINIENKKRGRKKKINGTKTTSVKENKEIVPQIIISKESPVKKRKYLTKKRKLEAELLSSTIIKQKTPKKRKTHRKSFKLTNNNHEESYSDISNSLDHDYEVKLPINKKKLGKNNNVNIRETRVLRSLNLQNISSIYKESQTNLSNKKK